jgi:hypothetical protein
MITGVRGVLAIDNVVVNVRADGDDDADDFQVREMYCWSSL